jgi:tryptophan synthase alpha chain
MTGVTGAALPSLHDVERSIATVREALGRSALPVCVGFGISQPDEVRVVCRFAEGAVVGSALVRQVEAGATAAELGSSVRALKAATQKR